MKPINLHIRPFIETDRDKLREIYLTCRQHTFYWMDINSFSIADFDTHTLDEDIWVATDDNKIAGFMAVWPPNAFIHHLYIDASYRRIGIGKALLSFAIQTYPSPQKLKCLIKNEAAIQFYKTLGWEIVEKVNDTIGGYFLMKHE